MMKLLACVTTSQVKKDLGLTIGESMLSQIGQTGEERGRSVAIPIYINTRNRITTTKKLAEQCSCIDDAVPIIVDNDSTWEPLVDWLTSCQFDVIQCGSNVGKHAPWRFIERHSDFNKRWGQSRYIVTDCDLDICDVPTDVMRLLSEPFLWKQRIIKSGLSLRIDDLPTWQSAVVEWESQWWSKPIRERFYSAWIDTTFAMYDCKTPMAQATKINVPTVRAAPPYCARHVPWYLDGKNLDDENRHYFDNATVSATWKPVGQSLVIHAAG